MKLVERYGCDFLLIFNVVLLFGLQLVFIDFVNVYYFWFNYLDSYEVKVFRGLIDYFWYF